jgi:hypothetical protein
MKLHFSHPKFLELLPPVTLSVLFHNLVCVLNVIKEIYLFFHNDKNRLDIIYCSLIRLNIISADSLAEILLTSIFSVSILK